ncbi:hypothetical protein D3C80_671660 [compost metagenome]
MASPAVIDMAMRHPSQSLIKAPIEGAAMVASETPRVTIAMPRPVEFAPTSRATTATESAQKPLSAIPSPARPTNNSQKSAATDARMLEPIASALSPTSTVLRFSLPMRTLLSKAVTAPTEAVAVTTCPAVPSVMPRSRAMGVNNPAGRNSADTSAKLVAAIERTANQVAAVHAGSSAASRPIVDPSNSDVVSVMVSLLELGEF